MSGFVEVVVGVIGRAHGLQGDVLIDVRTDEPERRFADGTVLHGEQDGRPFTVTRLARHGQRLVVRFAELSDRTAVEQARGTVLVARVPADTRPDDDDEYYDHQLVGLAARVEGARVGTVTGVVHLGPQDLLVLDTAHGERMVPFVAALVPHVDLDAGAVDIVDLPGLLNDEADDTPPGKPGH